MNSKAFTLIELLIVVLIIAILAAIAVPNFLEFQTRAKVSRAKSDIRSLATAIEGYYVDNESYPICNSFATSANCEALNCPAAQQGEVLERLSTPIQYMTSGLLQDSFLVKFRTGNEYQGNEGDGSGQPGITFPYDAQSASPLEKVYLYQSVSSNSRADYLADASGEARGIAWLLGSVGPDAIKINLGGVLANNGRSQDGRGFETKFAYSKNLLYDPTNGTVSFGEIYRVGGDVGRDYASVFLQAVDAAR